jgi:hypothetical protein
MYSLSSLKNKEIISLLFEKSFYNENDISKFNLGELSRIIVEELYQENKGLFGNKDEEKLFKKKEKLLKTMRELF